MDFSGKPCIICQMLSTLSHTISQQVADIIDLYTELHGTRVSLFGPDRKMLYPDAEGRPNCSYCRMLRETLGHDARCRALDRRMMGSALEQRSMISYTCHGGMREAVAPLFSAGQLAGFVMIGQFRSRTAPPVSPYAADWRQTQGSDALQDAFSQSTILPEEKIETLLAMFSQLLELIIRGHLIHRRDCDLIEPVIERIRQNPAQPLRLEQAALMAGRSGSTVTRLFKKMTGRSFKQYQTDIRLQRAAELLLARPNCPVSQIARQIGMEDPFYFSRSFHKHTGLSPSDYRKINRRK